jgi:peroxiredoxin Q/BCP
MAKHISALSRATFLIDGCGNITKAWLKVSVKDHVEEVLAACAS